MDFELLEEFVVKVWMHQGFVLSLILVVEELTPDGF